MDIVSAPAFFSDVATAAANVSGGVFASDACTVTSLRDRVFVVVVKAASRPFPMRDATLWWSAKKLDLRLNVEDDENVFEAAVAVILLFAVALTVAPRERSSSSGAGCDDDGRTRGHRDLWCVGYIYIYI